VSLPAPVNEEGRAMINSSTTMDLKSSLFRLLQQLEGSLDAM
jgi:hypothetical protein